MAPKKPKLKKAQPTVRRSSIRLAQLRLNRQTKSQSASLCIPLDEFPLEIVEHVFSFISINPHIVPADLFNLILVDKRMYSAFSPKLYRTLTVNQWTAESLFCGIDHALVSNDGDVRHTRHSEGPANHTESAEGEESLVTSPMKKASETEPEAEAEAEVKQEPTYGAFGLDSLSIHKRRIGLLQHTKALIIEDWEGAKAIALGMGLLQEQADIDLAKLAEESEGSDYDHDGEDYYLIAKSEASLWEPDWNAPLGSILGPMLEEPIQSGHPVILTLSNKLRPEHVCADFRVAEDCETFAVYMGYLLREWSVKSFTWHNIRPHAELPYYPFKLPLLRLVCMDCIDTSGTATNDDDPWPGSTDCHCYYRVENARRDQICEESVPPDASSIRRRTELINLTHLGTVAEDDITEDGTIIEQRSDNNETQDEKKRPLNSAGLSRINITAKQDAEPCICCGLL